MLFTSYKDILIIENRLSFLFLNYNFDLKNGVLEGLWGIFL